MAEAAAPLRARSTGVGKRGLSSGGIFDLERLDAEWLILCKGLDVCLEHVGAERKNVELC